MTLSPWWTLAAIMVALLAVCVGDWHFSHRRAKRLRRLADRCGFRYSSVDRFGLARRVRSELPGSVHNVLIRDLMYRSDGGAYVYAFTVVYEGEFNGTTVLHAREQRGNVDLHDVRHGDPSLPLGEQYRRLLHEATPG